MPSRRGFLATLLAAGGLPALSWADAGSPAYVAAARDPDGSFALFGLTAAGVETFRVPLPDRGHAAAAHPTLPEAVAFARRPGTYMLVLDCVSGRVINHLQAPDGHHFYGHGAFVAGGDILCTTENHVETGQGHIGLWSRPDGYRRIGGFPSQGIGPHELKRIPDTDLLAIANGGIRTDPGQGREKLNIPTMQPNLAYADADRGVFDRVELAPELHKNSIRHLDITADGLVAFAMQWQGDLAEAPPLLGLHRRGQPVRLLSADFAEQMMMQGYAGSVAFCGDGSQVAITSPVGGRVHRFAVSGAFLGVMRRADICGVATAADGFFTTDGQGGIQHISGDNITPLHVAKRAWDNHVVAL